MWLLLGQSWWSDYIKLYCKDAHDVDGSYRDDTTLQHIRDLQRFPLSRSMQNATNNQTIKTSNFINNWLSAPL